MLASPLKKGPDEFSSSTTFPLFGSMLKVFLPPTIEKNHDCHQADTSSNKVSNQSTNKKKLTQAF